MEVINKESKTLLAKLLATEDISVVHRKMPSAYFDTKNRELGLPILKKMNGDIYDLMTLHEVGHALWTDNDEWMAIVKNDNDDDLPKSFINVTEDVRIERKIKDKYPGGVKSFFKGYANLYKDNFFGTAGKDFDEMNLADKINLHSKVGSLTGITFNEEETVIYDMCKDAVTFTHAVDAARAMYEYCKENDQDLTGDDDHDMMGWEESEGIEGDETVEIEGSQSEDSGENSDTNSENSETKKEGSGESDPEDEGKETENPATIGRKGGMGAVTNPIQAETVMAWENNKEDLNDCEGRDYWYTNIPESNLDTIINYKDCLKSLSTYYKKELIDDQLANDRRYGGDHVSFSRAWIDASYKYASKIEKESMKTVNYMLKEFEMKKSADSYHRTSIAKTGVLDMLKMHSYKYNDDIFKRITVEPDGKNHGLVMFIDWSASMSTQHHDCFKQLLQIVWFCRRAGIKFEVYAFSDSAWSMNEKTKTHRKNETCSSESPTWNYKNKDLSLSNHLLLNLFSDRMTKQDMKTMVHYLTMVTYSISGSYNYYNKDESPLLEFLSDDFYYQLRRTPVLDVPSGWHLGGTPLNGAIINAMNFIPKYRTKNGIQNLNVVFITDGASNDGCRSRINFDKPSDDYNGFTEYCPNDSQSIFFDPITKKTYSRSEMRRSSQCTTATLLQMLKDRTKCNVVGFFLAQTSGKSSRVSNNDLSELFPNEDLNNLRRTLKKDKVLVCENSGYDEYYFVAGGKSLEIDESELQVNGDMTRGKMAKGFANYMKGKTVNRVLLNKFVQQIA